MENIAAGRRSRFSQMVIPALVLIFAAGAVGTTLLNFHFLFLRLPSAWPDEGLFAAPALDLMVRGKMGTELMEGVLPGMAERTYWMPPVYFVALSSFFKLAGFSIESLRAFSFLFSFLVLGLFYRLARRASGSVWTSVFAVSLVLMSYRFVRASYVGRMEMLNLFFLFTAASLAGRAIEKRNFVVWGLAGFFCGLAGMTHPFGVVGAVAVGLAALLHSAGKDRLRAVLFAALGVLIPVLPWVVYILGNVPDFIAQFGSQLARKAASVRGLVLDYNFSEIFGADWRIGLVVTLGSLMGLSKFLRLQSGLKVLFWLQLTILLMLVTTKEMWYPVYALPLGVLGWALLIRQWVFELRLPKWARFAGVFISVVLTFAVIRGGLLPLSKARGEAKRGPEFRASYHRFSAEISDALPSGARVLIAAIPDPTLDLMKRKDLTLRHFSPVPVAPELYQAYIGKADYIVLAGEVDGRVAEAATRKGVLVRAVSIPGDGDYQAKIYRMR